MIKKFGLKHMNTIKERQLSQIKQQIQLTPSFMQDNSRPKLSKEIGRNFLSKQKLGDWDWTNSQCSCNSSRQYFKGIQHQHHQILNYLSKNYPKKLFLLNLSFGYHCIWISFLFFIIFHLNIFIYFNQFNYIFL